MSLTHLVSFGCACLVIGWLPDDLRGHCRLKWKFGIIIYYFALDFPQKSLETATCLQRWSHRGRPWPRGHILKSLALASKAQVFGFGLEALGPRKLPCPRLRGQHYFFNRWNFVEKRQKPRGKFANTFFVFHSWNIGLAKLTPPLQLKFHQWQKRDKKAYCFFSFSFFLAFFAYTSSEQQYWRAGARDPLKSILANQFKRKPGRKG